MSIDVAEHVLADAKVIFRIMLRVDAEELSRELRGDAKDRQIFGENLTTLVTESGVREVGIDEALQFLEDEKLIAHGNLGWGMDPQYRVTGHGRRCDLEHINDCLVTLSQVEPMVTRTKRTLMSWLKKGRLPKPSVRGEEGTPHQWWWSDLRSSLEPIAIRPLPVRFPGGDSR